MFLMKKYTQMRQFCTGEDQVSMYPSNKNLGLKQMQILLCDKG